MSRNVEDLADVNLEKPVVYLDKNIVVGSVGFHAEQKCPNLETLQTWPQDAPRRFHTAIAAMIDLALTAGKSSDKQLYTAVASDSVLRAVATMLAKGVHGRKWDGLEAVKAMEVIKNACEATGFRSTWRLPAPMPKFMQNGWQEGRINDEDRHLILDAQRLGANLIVTNDTGLTHSEVREEVLGQLGIAIVSGYEWRGKLATQPGHRRHLFEVGHERLAA